MKNEIKRCYKKCFRKQKSRFGMTLDMTLGTILSYIVLCLILREIGFVRYIASVLALGLTAVFAVLCKLTADIRLKKYIKAERKKLLADICIKHGLFMSDEEFEEVMCSVKAMLNDKENKVAVFRTMHETDADSIIGAYRAAKAEMKSSLTVVSLSGLDTDAEKIATKIDDLDIKIIDQAEIMRSIEQSLKLYDDDLDRIFFDEYNKAHAKTRLLEKFKRGKSISPYLVCGVALFVLSFFLKYALYYRLLGSLCLWICFGLTFTRKYKETGR